MANNETLRPQYPDQVRECLTVANKTLRYYIPGNVPDLLDTVEFRKEGNIRDGERKMFVSENSISTMLGGETAPMVDLIFEPSGKAASVDGSILLSSDFFLPLKNLNGQNIKDRKFVSGLDVMLFGMVASSTLEIIREEVEVVGEEVLVTRQLKKFAEFIDAIAVENPNSRYVADFKDGYYDFVVSSDPTSYSFKINGLCVSLCYQDKVLFTSGYDMDEAMRFRFVNSMRKKFISSMEKKNTWFSPSDRVRKDIIVDRGSEDLSTFLNKYAEGNDDSMLLSSYVSGEMGRAHIEFLANSSSKELATLIKNSMLSRDESQDLYGKYKDEVVSSNIEVTDESYYEEDDYDDEDENYEQMPIRQQTTAKKFRM